MDNYYKKKADKYKYKYLKLKNRIEYIGGGGEVYLSYAVQDELKMLENRCTETCKKNNNVNSLVYATGYKSTNFKKCIEDCKNEVNKLREKKIDEQKEEDKKLNEILAEIDRKDKVRIDEEYKAEVEAKKKAKALKDEEDKLDQDYKKGIISEGNYISQKRTLMYLKSK
jgi:hypothetical protein